MSKQIIKPQTLKGFRDFFPSQTVERQFLMNKIKTVFERYGFQPIETPALEYLETFSGNIGEEEKLFFKFEDQGGRKVALRYDQTVPTARFIAQYKNSLIMPFKRYQFQTVWRSEKPQKGRYREFLQCDADIFGIKAPEADAEVIALSLDIYKYLGFKNFIVKINDRALYGGIPYEAIASIDKLSKIGKEGVIENIVSKGFSKKEGEQWLSKVTSLKPNETLERIFTYLKELGFSSDQFQFDPTIARSFSYSTGPIWEVVIPEYSAGSVLGGERYDELIGKFTDNNIPATGFALGFDRTLEAMRELNLLPALKPTPDILVTVFSKESASSSLKLVNKLRNRGIKTDIYLDFETKLDKQLKYAAKTNIPYVVIIGPDEIKENIYTLKNMSLTSQEKVSYDELVSKVLP